MVVVAADDQSFSHILGFACVSVFVVSYRGPVVRAFYECDNARAGMRKAFPMWGNAPSGMLKGLRKYRYL